MVIGLFLVPKNWKGGWQFWHVFFPSQLFLFPSKLRPNITLFLMSKGPSLSNPNSVFYTGEASYSTKNPAELKKKPKLKPIALQLTSFQITVSKLKSKVTFDFFLWFLMLIFSERHFRAIFLIRISQSWFIHQSYYGIIYLSVFYFTFNTQFFRFV